MKSYVILIFLTCPYLLAQEVDNFYLDYVNAQNDLSTSTVTSSGGNCGDIKSTLVAFASMTFLVFGKY
jgi:2-methylaconitate cis-trans-isomerase PrpF